MSTHSSTPDGTSVIIAPSARKKAKASLLPSKQAWARLLLAIFGSYTIASLVSLLPLALPVLSVSAIAWGRILAVVVASFSFVAVYLIEPLAKAYGVILAIIAGLLGLCVVLVPNFMTLLGGAS